MAFCYGRQESVNEDELFGEGRSSSGVPTAQGADGNTSGNNIPLFEDLLPNFGLLDENFKANSSDQENQEGENKDFVKGEDKSKEEIKSPAKLVSITGMSDQNDSAPKDFIKVYRNKGSVSTVECKRDRFRNRSDIEVFYEDDMYEVLAPSEVRIVRKSNSLPDVILSSSSSPSLKCHSDNSSASPDVTLSSLGSLSSNRDLEEKKRQKDSFEGKSSLKDKQSEVFSQGSYNQRSGGTITEDADEGFTDDSSAIPKALDDDIDRGDEAGTDVNQRRQLYSKSSGYQTGSESRDKSKGSLQSQMSTSNISQVSSEPWTSNEIPDFSQINQETTFGNLPLMSGFNDLSFNDTISEGKVSTGTKIESVGSALSSHSSDKSISQDSEKGEKDGTAKHPSLTFKRLKTESYSETDSVVVPFEGNGLCDSSVCIGQSTIEHIRKEEREELQKQVDKWNRGSLNPSSLMASNDPRSSISDFQTLNKDTQRELFEDKLKKGEDVQELFSCGSTPSPSPADIGKVVSPGQKFTRNCLERASRCSTDGCDEKACTKLRNINKVLEKKVVLDTQDDELLHQYFQSLIQHHSYCEEIWCKVRYCQLLDTWHTEDEKILKECIRRHLREPFMNVLASNNYKFEQISKQDIRKEDLVSVLPVSVIGSFGTVILCIDNSQHMCVVKKFALFEDHHQLSLYNRLRDHHPYIVDQLWVLEHDNVIQICSDFMAGGSLFEYMKTLPKGRLNWQTAMTYLQQMLSALSFLHKNGVVFLNWHSKNMLFSDLSYRSIKLNNFCLSCPLNVQSDIGAIKQCLLPAITPPELVEAEGRVSFQSDIWGVGCQACELLTGVTVWHGVRHESREYFHKKICCKIPTLPGDLTDKQINLFNYCWKINPKERYTTDRLYDYITKWLRGQTGNT